MGLKKLADYGLKFKDLKKAAVSLNKVDIAEVDVPTKIGTNGEVMLEKFLDAIESIHKNDLKMIPKGVARFYEELPEDVFKDSDTEDTDENTTEEKSAEKKAAKKPTKSAKSSKKAAKSTKKSTKNVEESEEQEELTKEDKKEIEKDVAEVTSPSECPSFGKSWNAKEPDCQACKVDMPDEYKQCKKATKAHRKEVAKKRKKGTMKRLPGKRTRYGHSVGSMAGCIDDLIYEGHTREEMTNVLMKLFSRTERVAKQKVFGHINHLIKHKGVKIEEKDDFIKGIDEYVEGMDADNTIPWDYRL